MKVSAIRSYTPVSFAGNEKSKKANAAKTAAGAAMIALATAMPAQEADAQIFYPYVPPTHYYYVPRPMTTMSVPNCFIDGDMQNFEYDKSMNQVFSEIDAKVDANRELSVNEVVKAERDNWHLYNYYPYNSTNMRNTARQFKLLSEVYNEKGSNPKTISYSEYKKIMNDYMDQQNVTSFFMLMDLLSRPRYRHCHPYMTPPPPPPHHHHRH